ncbi:hypothetical protein [Streptomyces goshikiensis]|uniref:hypothetical protein n=1 Tax=Streptomyces goshikiensis TaxID=1942 RepID=UPI00366463E0
MTTRIEHPATVTARIDDSDTLSAALNPTPALLMSREESQHRTWEELADDIIVDGVAYSRAEWDRIQEGVQHATTDETPAPATRRTRSTWNGTDAPF